MAINRKLSPIPQIYSLETTILAKNNSCQFSQISRKIYIVCKIGPKIEFGSNLMSHPGYVEINTKLSPIPQIYTRETTILAKNNSCQFSQISRKIYIVCKIGPKIEFGSNLMSHPGYVEINTKLSPIPQIYTRETTILAKNNSCQFSQISRKIYIVCKIGPKIEFGGTLMSHPLAMWQSIQS